MGNSHRRHPHKRNTTRETKRMIQIRREKDEKQSEKIQKRRMIGIRKKIRGKRILLAKVAVMTEHELADHRANAARNPKFPAATRAAIVQMSPEEFRRAWMAGLRKLIRDLHGHVSQDKYP